MFKLRGRVEGKDPNVLCLSLGAGLKTGLQTGLETG